MISLKSLPLKYKLLGIIAIFLIIFDFALLGVKFISSKRFAAPIYIGGFFSHSENFGIIKGRAKKPGTDISSLIYFAFNENQQLALNEFYKNEKYVSIVLRIGIKNAPGKSYNKINEAEKLFYYGFVYPENIDLKGNITTGNQPLVGADLRNFIKNSSGEVFADLGFALQKNLLPKSMPVGFFISAMHKTRIYGVSVIPAKVGFDFRDRVPFYGLAPNGGSFTAFPNSVDFSGCSEVFSSVMSSDSLLPVLKISFADNQTQKNTLNAGGEVLHIYGSQEKNEIQIQTSILSAPFSVFEIKDSSENVSTIYSAFYMEKNDFSLISENPSKVLKPLKTDFGLIPYTKMKNWRTVDYELYEWAIFPHVLLFDIRDYSVQDDFFRRMAFFVEKTGYKGTILSDEELGSMHGFNAHDYRAESIADFFTKAYIYNTKLNDKEELLKEICLANGIILKTDSGFAPGYGAVLSISQSSMTYLRNSLMNHECWHGIYFVDDDFKNIVSAAYYTIDTTSLDFLKGFWQSQPSLSYDQKDDYLMKNEFMAYILQQPLRYVAPYFVSLANRGSVNQAIPKLCQYIRKTNAAAFEDAGRFLDSYVYDRWGLASGRISLVTR